VDDNEAKDIGDTQELGQWLATLARSTDECFEISEPWYLYKDSYLGNVYEFTEENEIKCQARGCSSNKLYVIARNGELAMHIYKTQGGLCLNCMVCYSHAIVN